MEVIDYNKLKLLISEFSLDKVTRKREIVYQRAHVANFLRENSKLPLREIGMLLGGKNHATILNAIKVHNNFKNDELYRYLTEVVRVELQGVMHTDEDVKKYTELELEFMRANTLQEFRDVRNKWFKNLEKWKQA